MIERRTTLRLVDDADGTTLEVVRDRDHHETHPYTLRAPNSVYASPEDLREFAAELVQLVDEFDPEVVEVVEGDPFPGDPV